MSPRFRPDVRVRQINPFGSYYTITSPTTATPTPTQLLDQNPYSMYSKYASDYSEYTDSSEYTNHIDYTDYHHATTALWPTVTATTTVTGAHADATATPTGAYDHGNQNNHHASGISSSAIAGIAVGSVLGLSVVGALLVWFCLRGRKSPNEGDDAGSDQERHSGGALAPAAPMVGPVGPSVHAIPQPVPAAAAASAAAVAPRLPSPFRQRHQTGSEEETVAFAKASNTTPARSIEEDPPAYEETEGHRRAGAASGDPQGYAPLPMSPLSLEYAAGAVSDGFRRYHAQPVDTESKPYDHLGRV